MTAVTKDLGVYWSGNVSVWWPQDVEQFHPITVVRDLIIVRESMVFVPIYHVSSTIITKYKNQLWNEVGMGVL